MRRPKPPQFVEAPTSQKPFYVARTGPMRPQTVWSLEDGQLVETCGKQRKAWALSSLKTLTLVGEPGSRWRAAHLMMSGRRVVIPAQSLLGNLSFQDRSGAFDAFLAALQAETAAASVAGGKAPSRGARQAAQALIWAIILTAGGALFMIVAALISGLPDLGLAVGARLLFVPILLAAALPWVLRQRG